MRLSFSMLLPFLGVFCLGALAPACEDENSDANVKAFTDQAGRSCSTDPHDVKMQVDCDVEPSTIVTCTDGKVAVWTVGANLMGNLENCAACLDEATHTSVGAQADCVPVTCNTDADCIEDRYTCLSNTCQS